MWLKGFPVVCLCVLIPAVCCLSMLVSLIGSVLLDATPSRVSIKTVPTTRRQAYLTQARQISRRTQKSRYEIFPGEELSGQNKKNICQAVQWRAEGELKQGKIGGFFKRSSESARKGWKKIKMLWISWDSHEKMWGFQDLLSGSPIGWNKERYFMQGAGGAGVDEHWSRTNKERHLMAAARRSSQLTVRSKIQEVGSFDKTVQCPVGQVNDR